jgi:flagellar protein FlaJ
MGFREAIIMSKTIRRFAYLRIGKYLEPHLDKFSDLGLALRKAGLDVSLRTYLSLTIFSTILAGLLGFLIPLILTFLILGHFMWLLAIISSPLCALITFGTFLIYPNSKAGARKRKIETALPSTASYMAAMTSAGVPPDRVIMSLANEEIDEEIREEAKNIARDLEMLGYDILKALKEAAKRAPSAKYSAFLEGIIATIVSGGDLKDYMSTEAKSLMRLKEQETREFISQLGVVAELFLTGAVVAPLFFVVMLSVMSAVGGGGGESSAVGLYAIVYGLIPLIMVAIVIITESMTPLE